MCIYMRIRTQNADGCTTGVIVPSTHSHTCLCNIYISGGDDLGDLRLIPESVANNRV